MHACKIRTFSFMGVFTIGPCPPPLGRQPKMLESRLRMPGGLHRYTLGFAPLNSFFPSLRLRIYVIKHLGLHVGTMVYCSPID